MRAGSPAAILAVIPHLLGFEPESSFVVVGISPDTGRVEVTLRYDLPDPSCDETAACIAEHAVTILASQRLTATLAAGYGPDDLVRPLARALLKEAPSYEVSVQDVLRLHNGRYWSYTCTNITCCPPAGTPVDNADDPAAKAIGDHVLPSRAALAATLAPVTGNSAELMRDATARAEQHITRVIAACSQAASHRPARAQVVAEGLAAVAETIDTYREGGSYRTDDQLAWLSVVLRDLRIRDDAWARMDPAHRAEHLRLWTDITRHAQPGYIAAPASLLAFVAWQSGHGALANVALDRAQDDDPAYSMAELIRRITSSGMPPADGCPPVTPEEVADAYGEYDWPDSAGGSTHQEADGEAAGKDDACDDVSATA
jgi:hypothetical protein